MSSTRFQLDSTPDGSHLPEMETLIDANSYDGALTGSAAWAIRFGQFWGGLSGQVEMVELDNGRMSVCVLPTRGMGIWKAHCDDVPIGWDSPVQGPVHPLHVNLKNRNGLGWLDGFDELVVRCGLAFNGPPGHDDGAASPIESDITLHGRIANIPAREVEAFVDEEQGVIGVTGLVDESTLFGPQLEMRSTITTRPGSGTFTIRDEILNVGAAPTELELLYHNNIGLPFLEEGAVIECPVALVVPRDARAAEGIQDYRTCLGPTTGYAEQAYFMELLADSAGETLAMLRNRTSDLGLVVRYQQSQLPCFCLWKCTQDERAGYVVGLEPATNFPNFKAFERHHGRVKVLQPEETYVVEIQVDILTSAEEVRAAAERIRSIQSRLEPKVHRFPVAPYCPID